MKDGNFYQISGWMGNRLGLRGNDLICFAVIYGLSQDEETWFSGNLDYLSGCMFCSRPTTLLCLEKLLKLDLIKKHVATVNGKKRCYYKATVSFTDGHIEYLQKEDTSKEPLPNTSKDPLPMTGKDPLPNNKYNNNKEKRLSKDNPKKVFVKPTIEQIEAYIREKGYHFDAEQFWNHYESVGWMIGKNHMKDWHCACATWEGRRKQERKEKEEKEETQPDEIPADDIEVWSNNQKWMSEKTPRIASKVTYQMFSKMRALATWNNRLYAELLMEIDQSGYDGDIVAEFERRLDKH